jgi:ribokinase
MNLVVVGSLNMDILIPTDPYPGPGETVMGGDIQYVPGGKGANQAVAAARLGAHVTMLGMVGADGYGKQLKKMLEHDHVDTELIQTSDKSSGVAFVHIEKDGENRIIVSPGANYAYGVENVLKCKNMIERADAVLVQLEIPIETVKAVLDIAAVAGVPTFLDPAPARADLFEQIGHVDWIVPNESEVELLTGQPVYDIKTARLAAAKLQQLGARRVLLKVGSYGAYVSDENGMSFQPGFQVVPVDTTAAGDAFCAAFVVDYLRYNSVHSALRVACAAGALTVTKQGAQPSLPYAEDVKAFLDVAIEVEGLAQQSESS